MNGIAAELESWAAYFANVAVESYPEAVFPPPAIGKDFTPDVYAAAGYRNAYRLVADSLRRRAAELNAPGAAG